MERPDWESFVRALPKAELHVHLEGSIAPELALTLARRHGIALPGAERGVEGLRSAYRFASFHDFIHLYLALSSCLCDAQDFQEVVLALGESLVAQGIVHAEVTFTPLTHHARGVSFEEMWIGLQEGRAEVARRGVELRWVFDVVRTLPDQARPTLDFSVGMQERDPGSVVGLGLGGPELPGEALEPFAPIFAQASAMGLRRLPHAGEQAGAENVRAVLERLGADRIGHGIRSLEDPALLDRLRADDIALEVCPTSNVALGVVESLEVHPLPALMEAGLGVVLGSDDPGLFGADLVEVYLRCIETWDWSTDTVRALAAASIDRAFMSAQAAGRLHQALAAVPEPSGVATVARCEPSKIR